MVANTSSRFASPKLISTFLKCHCPAYNHFTLSILIDLYTFFA